MVCRSVSDIEAILILRGKDSYFTDSLNQFLTKFLLQRKNNAIFVFKSIYPK
jgi:hypothetical protein